MNATSAQPGLGVEAQTSGRWPWLLAGLLVCLVAVNGASLWVDEALTANEVSHAGFRGMWDMLARDKGSDLQMPLYVFHLWAWVKIFGTSEWALRAINIPWFLLAVAACGAAFAGRERTAVMVAVMISPFTWYFLNEARPYAVQISTSLVAFAALNRLARNNGLTSRSERAWLAVFCFGVVCLSASSLLGMIWAGAFLLAAGWCLLGRRLVELQRSHRALFGISFVLLLATGLYYLWTLRLGARATAGNTDARNLAFIGYELFGFGGLGPGRLEIRNGTLAAFLPFALPLIVFAVLIFFIAATGMRQIWRAFSGRRLAGLVVIAIMPAVVLIAAGHVLHFRVLERHFAPAIAVVVYMLAAGMADAWRRGGVPRGLACALVLLSLASCLEVRFAPRHKKDDYRDAAAYARDALSRGERVWWNAGWHGAVYYHVPLGTNADDKSAAWWAINPGTNAWPALPAPDVVISSKPDMFDELGSVGEFVRKGAYAEAAGYPAFTVWRRPAKPAGAKFN